MTQLRGRQRNHIAKPSVGYIDGTARVARAAHSSGAVVPAATAHMRRRQPRARPGAWDETGSPTRSPVVDIGHSCGRYRASSEIAGRCSWKRQEMPLRFPLMFGLGIKPVFQRPHSFRQFHHLGSQHLDHLAHGIRLNTPSGRSTQCARVLQQRSGLDLQRRISMARSSSGGHEPYQTKSIWPTSLRTCSPLRGRREALRRRNQGSSARA